MESVRIGVIGLQGDVEEHINAFQRAFTDLGIKGEALWARRPADMESVDGIALPGGESTTISKLLTGFELREIILQMASEGSPILGTCAGCVLLANEGDEQVKKTRTELLGLMDMAVDRNAFGPQRESFEADIEIEGIGSYPGIFIRAPQITKVWGSCKALGTFDDRIILAKQDNLIAASFHPELTMDTRFHKMFLDML